MTILFITGCLESGKDGVGDYTKRLAFELMKAGHTCALLSLQDPFVLEPSKVSQEFSTILRLPIHWPNKNKIELSAVFHSEVQPDWISIQFVSYAFHSRGLVWWLSGLVQKIRHSTTKVHIMFHELWIGEAKKDSIAAIIWGKLQKVCILHLIKKCTPLLIHTSLPVFKKMLELNNVKVELLPLFGNIPVVSQPNTDWIYLFLIKKGIEISEESRSRYYVACFFGTLKSHWSHENILKILQAHCAINKKELLLVTIGRKGSHNTWDLLQTTYSENVFFVDFEEQGENNISSVLGWADVAISPVPVTVIGKSGTYAAMKDHGLPVLCNDLPTQLRFEFQAVYDNYENLILVKSAEENPLPFYHKKPKANSLEQIAHLFTLSLVQSVNL